MKIKLLAIVLLLTGCASSRIDSFLIESTERPYTRVLLIPFTGGHQLDNFNKEVYEDQIISSLSGMTDFRFRKQLNKTFRRNLTSVGTTLIPSIDLVPVTGTFSFVEFQRMLDDQQAQAILFVQLTDYWNEFSIVDGESYSEDNASFNCYLYDRSLEKFVWMSRTIVNGLLYSGYDVINNTLARKVAADLRKKGFINKYQSWN